MLQGIRQAEMGFEKQSLLQFPKRQMQLHAKGLWYLPARNL
jgi:hypothetical protein